MRVCENGKYRAMTPEEEAEYRKTLEGEARCPATDIERLEAQTLYTALMTDTLLEEN